MKISIITINRNNAEGLLRTIRSVVSQTNSDFEYIVIDGGSTDSSVEIIHQYSDKITYWVSESDKGIYNAMNKGILKATADYCLFLNSGDWLYNEQVIQRFIQGVAGSDLIYGNVVLSNGSGKLTVKKYHSFVPYDLVAGTIVHQVIFFKRTLFDKYGFYDESFKIASDWKFCFETVFIHNCSIEHIDEFVSYYDCTGVSSLMTLQDEKERNEVLNAYLSQSVIEDYKTTKLLDITQFFRVTKFAILLLYFFISWLFPLRRFTTGLSEKFPVKIKQDYIYNYKVNAILGCRFYRSLYYAAKHVADFLLRKNNIEIYY